MNCRRFQNRLYEYIDGTLSRRTSTAAGKHLARCSACRQAVRQEQQRAGFLSDRLHRETSTFALQPEIRRRILAAIEREPVLTTDGESIVGVWHRFAWPLTAAASLLLILAFVVISHFSGARVHKTETARFDELDTHSTVSIQLSYCVPTYKFRQEGNLVVDTLTCETMVADETLWTGRQEPVEKNRERKMPL